MFFHGGKGQFGGGGGHNPRQMREFFEQQEREYAARRLEHIRISRHQQQELDTQLLQLLGEVERDRLPNVESHPRWQEYIAARRARYAAPAVRPPSMMMMPRGRASNDDDTAAAARPYITLEDIPTWADVQRLQQTKKNVVVAPQDTEVLPAASPGDATTTATDGDATTDAQKVSEAAASARKQAKECLFAQAVSVFRGDITKLEVDAITNAANCSLLGGGGVDGAIHDAAGVLLVDECQRRFYPVVKKTTTTEHEDSSSRRESWGSGGGGGGRGSRGERPYRDEACETGGVVITRSYCLPALHYVLHAVGPMGSGDAELESCYSTSFRWVRETLSLESKFYQHGSNQHDVVALEQLLVRGAAEQDSAQKLTREEVPFPQLAIRSIAFPGISTGIYGFPAERAARIALGATRRFLEELYDALQQNCSSEGTSAAAAIAALPIKRIVFVCFSKSDEEIYLHAMPEFFPGGLGM